MSDEKLFNELLDRLLAGEQLIPDPRLSNDLRADLELARIMLAGRSEPSPDFRARLKTRLLRQLALQTIADRPVQKPGLAQWLEDSVNRKWAWGALATATLVLVLAVASTLWYYNRNQPNQYAAAPAMKAAPPEAARPEMAYSVDLPSRITPSNVTFSLQTQLSTAATQATIYNVNSPDVTLERAKELADRLGMTGQAMYTDDHSRIVVSGKPGPDARQLTVWTASGAVEWGYVKPDKLHPGPAANLPQADSAKHIAFDLLNQADLLPAGYDRYSGIENAIVATAGGGYPVSGQAAGQTLQTGAAYWLVDFPYLIGGIPATGPGGKIEVIVGDGGQVLSLFSGWRETAPGSAGNTRTEASAYDELAGGGGSIDVPQECSTLVIKQVELKYWIEPPFQKQTYALPVYEFRGDCLDSNGRTLETFTGWTKALN